MLIARYLPSAKFTVLVLSLALSAGLVYAAEWVTKEHVSTARLSTQTTVPTHEDWEAALFAIQAQNASTSIPPSDENAVNNLLSAAQSNNVTDTVGRTLLVNLTNAGSQGLGGDIPTQNQIISAAIEQLQSQTSLKLYTSGDLNVVPKSDKSAHDYGNEVFIVLTRHPEANVQQVLLAIGLATDSNDASKLAALHKAEAAYHAIADELSLVPVPQTLAPLHLAATNDFLRIANTLKDMQTITTDPLRGLAGLQSYEAMLSEANRVFTNIAQNLHKDGILFTKDEPGAAWETFLVSP